MSLKSRTSSSMPAAWRALSAASALLLVPGVALAHYGGGPGGLVAGALHPLLGLDHLLAMVASGLWASRFNGVGRLGGPAAFVTGMAAGAALGMAGVTLPAVETLVAASVIALGLLVAAPMRPPTAVALPVFAAIGAWHGDAHGLEAHDVGGLLFLVGMIATTGLLHVVGVLTGGTLLKSPAARSASGAALAVAGLGLLVTA